MGSFVCDKKHNNGGCGGDAQSMAFLLVFVQPFPLFVGSKMMVWTMSRSHDSFNDDTDWPIGGMQYVDVTFLDRLRLLGTKAK